MLFFYHYIIFKLVWYKAKMAYRTLFWRSYDPVFYNTITTNLNWNISHKWLSFPTITCEKSKYRNQKSFTSILVSYRVRFCNPFKLGYWCGWRGEVIFGITGLRSIHGSRGINGSRSIPSDNNNSSLGEWWPHAKSGTILLNKLMSSLTQWRVVVVPCLTSTRPRCGKIVTVYNPFVLSRIKI